MLEDTPPPSYAVATSNETPAPEYQDLTERTANFLYFHRTTHGIRIFDATNDREPRFYVGRYQVLDHPEIVLYRGSDRNHPAAGQATFSRSEKDFIIAVDGPATALMTQRELVRCISSQKMFGADSYQFTVPESTESEEDNAMSQNLVWKHTHDAHLGSGVWKTKDFKLMDEATQQVVAVYINLSETNNVMSRLEWKMPRSLEAEIRALVVLMAFIERIRRSKKQAGRAVVVGAAQGPRKGRSY